MSPPEETAILATLTRMESNLREDIKSAEGRVREDITGIRTVQDEHTERIVAIEVKSNTSFDWPKVLKVGGVGGGVAFVPWVVHQLDLFFSASK